MWVCVCVCVSRRGRREDGPPPFLSLPEFFFLLSFCSSLPDEKPKTTPAASSYSAPRLGLAGWGRRRAARTGGRAGGQDKAATVNRSPATGAPPPSALFHQSSVISGVSAPGDFFFFVCICLHLFLTLRFGRMTCTCQTEKGWRGCAADLILFQ